MSQVPDILVNVPPPAFSSPQPRRRPSRHAHTLLRAPAIATQSLVVP
uniref:Uncharacterized protein n=1 Tax=Arundo donax TaxID=35708 RepID=A0A0A9TIL0_ARUDO